MSLQLDTVLDCNTENNDTKCTNEPGSSGLMQQSDFRSIHSHYICPLLSCGSYSPTGQYCSQNYGHGQNNCDTMTCGLQAGDFYHS